MASPTPSGVRPDCGAEFSRTRRGYPRRRCERCNRRHQNAQARAVPRASRSPPGTPPACAPPSSPNRSA